MEININLFILADSGAHVKVALSVEPSCTLESLVVRSGSSSAAEEIGNLLKYTNNIDFVVFGEIVNKNVTVGALFREITSASDDGDGFKEEGVAVEQPLSNMVGECSIYVISKRSISITIKTITGKEYQLFVNLCDTVGQLKERLCNLGYGNDGQFRLMNILLHKEKGLNPELKDDAMSLEEYCFRDECIIFIVPIVRHG